MAKTVTSTCAITGEKMAAPSITLLPDKRSPTNSHSSPARAGKTTPSNTEKKTHINGYASPSHLAASISNTHADVEGYMKTDDRMRLAKERREERERSLAAREQLIREKEHRARLQYERTVEERWRRLEEQRQKEELRRAAVEEKRRQQLEEERERLEALMRRSLERSLQLEQRAKRWSRGCPTGAGESENAPLPFSAASTFSHGIASPLPAVSESAPCSPHRSPFCSSLNPADHNRAGFQGGSQSTPNTPKRERLRRDRRTASPGCGSPVRRPESPASVTKHLASPTTSKLASKIRAQSPSNSQQYHYSPTRHRLLSSTGEKKAEGKNVEKQANHEPVVKKSTDNNSMHPSSQAETNVPRSCRGQSLDKHLRGNTSENEKNQSPDRKQLMAPVADSSGKKMQANAQNNDKKKESAPCTPTAKVAAGTTNAEEATRLLTERRRLARAQKELEEKKLEEERDEQRKKRLVQEQPQPQEAKAQQTKGKSEEDLHRLKQDNDKQKNEQQAQMDREKEKVKFQAQEDVERQRQGRELQTQQEEEERQLRKKRIEEIMKRTRKGEADLKKEEQVETKPVSSSGEEKSVQTKTQVNEQAIKKVEFQVNKPVPVQANMKDCFLVKKQAAAAAAALTDNQKSLTIRTDTEQVTRAHSVPDKRPDTRQTREEAKVTGLKQQTKDAEMNVNKEDRASIKATDQISSEATKLAADAKVKQKEGGMINGAVNGEGRVSMTAQVTKQQALHRPAAEGKAPGGSQVEVIRPTVTALPVAHLAPPVIKLEPLDVKDKGSCNEVQSMEVSPASKEELISIPEFPPVIGVQHSSVSNTQALEDLLDLTGSLTYSKLSCEGTISDCNKNLIEGVVSPMSDSKLIGISSTSANTLSIK